MTKSTYDGEYKRHKMGRLPGDLPKKSIVKMRETKEHPQGIMSVKGWINTLVRKANKRQRQRNKEDIRRELKDED